MDDGEHLNTAPEHYMCFSVGDIKFLEIYSDGRVLIRGQQVDDNVEIYKAFLEWQKAEAAAAEADRQHAALKQKVLDEVRRAYDDDGRDLPADVELALVNLLSYAR
jgi:hypothetical protein